MSSYSLLIFLHILAATGVFAGWGIEAVIIRKLRKAERVEEARMLWELLSKQSFIGPVSMFVILVTGLWMGIMRWSHQTWMMLGFAGMIIIVVIGFTLSRQAMIRFKTTFAETHDFLPRHFYAAAGLLTISLRLRLAIGVSILALMTFKPAF